MTVRNLVGTLARTGVSTAVYAVRHPLGTASMAVGLVKGTAEVSAHLARTTILGAEQRLAEDVRDLAHEAAEPTGTAPQTAIAAERIVEPPAADPRDNIPGPDLAAFAPPAPEDLPEPIVIEAEPVAQEAFHTEPKAASRDSAHGGPAGDREEIEGYVEEIVLDDVDIEPQIKPQIEREFQPGIQPGPERDI